VRSGRCGADRRISLCSYESGELSDDERFTLMETILQSFEDLKLFEGRPDPDSRWQRVLEILDRTSISMLIRSGIGLHSMLRTLTTQSSSFG
jgi:hypothetical protein